MKITVTFDSLDEFKAHIKTMADREEEKTQRKAKSKEEKKPEEMTNEELDQAITEDFRAQVRGILAKLNKKTGVNTASQIISDVAGVGKLSEVPLDKLPELMDKAKEALDA